MSIAANITIQGQVTGGPSGSKQLAATIANGASTIAILEVTLPAATDVTITPPANAVGCLIAFIGGTGLAPKIKGSLADTGGAPLNAGSVTLYTFPPGAIFVLHGDASTQCIAELSWF